MSELDSALDRLGVAVTNLIATSKEGRADGASDQRIADLTAERNRLKAEVEQLAAQRQEDARLRSEAASAVKVALKDLRSLVAAQEAAKKKAG